MTTGEPVQVLIAGEKTVSIWDPKEEDEPNAEAGLTAEGCLLFREEPFLI